MTRDDIIRLAEEAGTHEGGAANWVNGNRWEQFAFLVAAAEREACAKVCDVLADKHTFEGGYANECAIAIRERGAP
jgi:hypothetical protein